MKKLYDINLRWSRDESPPEWFRKKGIIEYLFYRELRLLKIEVPNFEKINVYCESQPDAYDGVVFDKVTNVQVLADWTDSEERPLSELNEYFISLMVSGAKDVLGWFNIPTSQIDDAARRAIIAVSNFSIPIGKKSEQIGSGLTVRLHVRALPNLCGCIVILVLSRRGKAIGVRHICTTFPSPEIAIEDFESLSVNERCCVAKFRAAGARGNTVFARTNFDHTGMVGVHRIDTSIPIPPYFVAEPTFRIDVLDLIPKVSE